MKKNVLKSAFAIACVAAASVSGFISYDQHNKNIAAANMLCKENVEALSNNDSWFESLVSTMYEPKQYYCLIKEPCYITKVVNGQRIRIEGITYKCVTTLSPQGDCNITNYECRY